MKRSCLTPALLPVVLLGCAEDTALDPTPQPELEMELALDHGWIPDRAVLHDCTLGGLNYLTSTSAAAASLPDGYAPVDADGDGTIVVIVDVFRCESFTVGSWTIEGGTLFHEILLDGVVAPDGERVGWGFPMTHTNPLMRRMFTGIGLPGRPAQTLSVTYDGSHGEVVVDNVPPFGPDLAAGFDTFVELFVIPAGARFVQHHAFGNGIRAMAWTFVEDTPHFAGPPVPVDVDGAFSLPVVALLPLGFVAYTGHDLIVESVH